jgi:hypothetical protein
MGANRPSHEELGWGCAHVIYRLLCVLGTDGRGDARSVLPAGPGMSAMVPKRSFSPPGRLFVKLLLSDPFAEAAAGFVGHGGLDNGSKVRI